MQADPRFPNRPTHPDFVLLSEAVCANDDLTDTGPEAWRARVEAYVDLESISYMAMQRAERGLLHRGRPSNDVELVALMSAAMFDGFIAGCVFSQLKAEQGG